VDLVLGLSMTPATVRWVLVEGTTGEGAPIDRGSLDVPAADATDANLLIDAVLTPEFLDGNQIHAVGVTFTNDATSAVAAVLDAFAARGHRNVVAVSDGEAASALAGGVTDITDYDDVAVCIVEPGLALIALAARGSVAVERIDRPSDGADTLELTCSVLAALDVKDRRPDAIFVVGSDDVDVIVSSFAAVTDVPVFSAAEADLALARGAALAAARSIELQAAKRGLTARIGVLSMVLAAAVLTLFVSLSVALGLSLTPDSPSRQLENVSAAGEPAPAPSFRPPPTTGFVPQSVPKLAMTMVVAAPPAAPVPVAAPEYSPPPAYQPPAPVYVPPPYQEPRLRDRILERIPIINRFHEPPG
jgi:hypothetical protein